jgi:hypothetical protein
MVLQDTRIAAAVACQLAESLMSPEIGAGFVISRKGFVGGGDGELFRLVGLEIAHFLALSPFRPALLRRLHSL